MKYLKPFLIYSIGLFCLIGCTKLDDSEIAPNSQDGETSLKASNTIPNFRVGLQLADKAGTSQVGETQYTSYANNSGIWSDWASDINFFDPDVVKLYLEVEQTVYLTNLDFRLAFQGSDNGSNSQWGTVQYTPWASEGGGTTGLITDANAFDPDAYRVKIQTRAWTSDKVLTNFRLGIRMFDDHGNEAGYSKCWTPWASNGGGVSAWAKDRNGYDPDGFKITLEVKFQ